MNHTRNSKANTLPLIRGKQLIAFLLSVLMILTVLPTTVYAGSVGSSADDKSVGKDTMQNASTTYENIESGSADTDVYLTVDNSQLIVGVPTVVILSGNSDENGEYKGNYSVYAKGDIAGDQVLNIYPETDTVVMKQRGKLNKSASVSQIKTEFLSEDIVDGMTVTGDISAEGLTAGSWNGNFNFVVSMISRAVYYSSLERAVADANNLTTENADVKRENVENAVAALYIQDSTAYIRMMNDESNVQSMTISQNAVINLNNYTVTFAQGQYLTYNKNLSVLDGVINAVDSNYVISGSSTNTASTLSLRDLSLNETVTENIKTHAFQINSYSLNNNLDNVEINTTGSGNSSYGVYGINFRNENSVNEVNNYSFISDVINPIKIRGTQLCGNTTFYNPIVNIKTNTEATGIFATNMSKVVEINGCNVYCDVLNVIKGSGIVFNTTESAVINSTKDNPVTVYGKQWGLQTSPYGTTTINGGTYTSTNHTGYICGNADIYNAEFYVTNRENYSTLDKSNGLYCGSPKSTTKDSIVNLYNCKLGNKESINGNVPEFAITAKGNSYYAQKEINLYDCTLYQGRYSVFSYNYTSPYVKGITKFNMYGNTKLFRYNGGTEFTKEEVENAINTWKNNLTWGVNAENTCALGSIQDDNLIIDGNYYCYDFTQLPVEDAYEDYANVYDYR